MGKLGNIFKTYGDRYRKCNSIPLYILKAMSAIEKCRTKDLGGHIYKCGNCSKMHIQYNSCRNRHCPTCQGNKANMWVENRKVEMLPIPYYHVFFTVPDILNPIIQRNQKLMYDLMFKASSEALMDLIGDDKYVGAKAGFMSVLHTWGQNLMEHPHIHCLVAGGGFSRDENYWVEPKYSKYLIPVHVASRVFKGKFIDAFIKAYETERIKFVGEIEKLKTLKYFCKLKDQLYKKGWVVNIRPPFSRAEKVIEYLSRYLNRVAISNARILKVTDNKVSFRWKDNRDGKEKLMTLDVMEFMRRFLLHILPERFVKIRYYGFMSNGHRREKLKKCRQLLCYKVKEKGLESKNTWDQDYITESNEEKNYNDKNQLLCPYCNEVLIYIRELIPCRHGPVIATVKV